MWTGCDVVTFAIEGDSEVSCLVLRIFVPVKKSKSKNIWSVNVAAVCLLL